MKKKTNWNFLTYLRKELISKVFDVWEERYDKSNILFVDAVWYNSGNNREENYFKIPTNWEYDGSLEKDVLIWSNLYNFLRHQPKTCMQR